MAAKKDEGFLKAQIEEAKERLTQLEDEAQRVFKGLLARAHRSRAELEELLGKVNKTELAPELRRWANGVGVEMKKRLDGLQSKLVEASGVASQSQVAALGKELSRLSKKVDALAGKKGKSEVRA
jgi:flagellin-like hook-associated protein FlgL